MKTQVAIIGGGPAGSASAIFLAREGIKSIIIEGEEFPRFHIGESMTGECGAVVRRLGLEERMMKHNFPIKRNVWVYGTNGNTTWKVPVTGRDENWKLFSQFTWQVRRSEFDKIVQDEAVAKGATLIHGRATKPLLNEDGSVRGVQVRMADGGMMDIESEIVLDCSGQATFLANAGVTGPKYRGSYDKQIAIFSHVVGAERLAGATPDDTIIFYQEKYHWSWFIPVDDKVTSVGVVTPSAYFQGKNESKKDFLLREMHELNPELKRRLPERTLVEDVHVIPNYSYQVRGFCGKGYICVGDAHRFIDPIFSFGLYMALQEAEYIAPIVKKYLEGENRDASNPFAEWQVFAEKGIDVLEDMVDAFWEHPIVFALYVHRRYPDLITDIFAGRLHHHQPSEGIIAMRELLKRERKYDVATDDYSVPIGSRFHPERAPLWEEDGSEVRGTEEWMPQSQHGAD